MHENGFSSSFRSRKYTGRFTYPWCSNLWNKRNVQTNKGIPGKSSKQERRGYNNAKQEIQSISFQMIKDALKKHVRLELCAVNSFWNKIFAVIENKIVGFQTRGKVTSLLFQQTNYFAFPVNVVCLSYTT